MNFHSEVIYFHPDSKMSCLLSQNFDNFPEISWQDFLKLTKDDVNENDEVLTEDEVIMLLNATEKQDKKNNPVNHPDHYQHPSGIECIQVTEHFNFNLGNVIKYIWRADLKGYDLQDLEKAAWYLNREIERRKVK